MGNWNDLVDKDTLEDIKILDNFLLEDKKYLKIKSPIFETLPAEIQLFILIVIKLKLCPL